MILGTFWPIFGDVLTNSGTFWLEDVLTVILQTWTAFEFFDKFRMVINIKFDFPIILQHNTQNRRRT